MESPNIVIIGGPNGAGKSTTALTLLRETFGITEFVNADLIAQGLSPFNPDGAAIAAGRVMLDRLHELAAARESFAFETTLASRSFAPWIRTLKPLGYKFHLLFIWLPSAEIAVNRVATRVMLGGHHVPEDIIRRRYRGGLRNLFHLYIPMADSWYVYNNAEAFRPQLVARNISGATEVMKAEIWSRITEGNGP